MSFSPPPRLLFTLTLTTRASVHRRQRATYTAGIITAMLAIGGLAPTVHAQSRAPLDSTRITWTWRDVPASIGHSVPFKSDLTSPHLRIDRSAGLPSSTINAIAQWPDGALAIGTEAGLAIVRDNTLTTYTGSEYSAAARGDAQGNSSLPGNTIHDLLIAKNGCLWIATDRGLGRICDGAWSVLEPGVEAAGRFDDAALELQAGLSDPQRLFETHDGTIVVGSRCAGITLVDPATGNAKTVYADNDQNHWITGIDQDSTGRVWLGINGLGVAQLVRKQVKIFGLDQPWIRGDNIRALAVDQSDNLWVGTITGLGVRRADGTVQSFGADTPASDRYFWHITVLTSGAVWCLTDRGYVVYDGKHWTYAVFADFQPSWLGTLVEAREGATWFAGCGSIVRNPQYTLQANDPVSDRIQEAKRQIEQAYPNVEPAAGRLVDKAGRVWLTIHDQLLRYDGAKWQDLTSRIDSEDVSFLMTDSRGRVWVGTSGGGLAGFVGDETNRYNNDPDTARSVIYDMVEADDGVLYVGTQDGLYTLDGDAWECLSKRLLPGVFLQPHPVVVDGSGRIWFADINEGLFFYDGARIVCVSNAAPLQGRSVHDLSVIADGRVRVTTTRREAGLAQRQAFLCAGEVCTPTD